MSHSDNHMIPSAADERDDDQRNARDEEFDRLTAENIAATWAAIEAGDAQQLKFVADTVRDLLTEPGATELLVREAVLCGDECAGKSFVRLLDKSVQDDAEASANQELMRRRREATRLCIGPASKAQIAALQTSNY